jgi:hypothetical protein
VFRQQEDIIFVGRFSSEHFWDERQSLITMMEGTIAIENIIEYLPSIEVL